MQQAEDIVSRRLQAQPAECVDTSNSLAFQSCGLAIFNGINLKSLPLLAKRFSFLSLFWRKWSLNAN
ncbi:hypothetical protein BN440_2331 [Erwinia amylovora MR1]|nr:hypothetical protein BN440_2331 [Erwinia amylovora MR1]